MVDTPRLKTENDDSDLQYISEVDKIENKMYTKVKERHESGDSTDDSVIMTPLNKKRKNPFIKDENYADDADNPDVYTKSKVQAKAALVVDTDDEVLEIPSFQKNLMSMKGGDPKKKTTSLSDLFETSHDEENVPMNIVQPIKNMPLKQQHTAKASTNRLIKMNSFALGDLKNANKSSLLNESVEMKPLTNTGYYFQYDGLGGRKKVPAKTENLKSSLFSSASTSKMQKFSRSKVT